MMYVVLWVSLVIVLVTFGLRGSVTEDTYLHELFAFLCNLLNVMIIPQYFNHGDNLYSWHLMFSIVTWTNFRPYNFLLTTSSQQIGVLQRVTYNTS